MFSKDDSSVIALIHAASGETHEDNTEHRGWPARQGIQVDRDQREGHAGQARAGGTYRKRKRKAAGKAGGNRKEAQASDPPALTGSPVGTAK